MDEQPNQNKVELAGIEIPAILRQILDNNIIDHIKLKGEIRARQLYHYVNAAIRYRETGRMPKQAMSNVGYAATIETNGNLQQTNTEIELAVNRGKLLSTLHLMFNKPQGAVKSSDIVDLLVYLSSFRTYIKDTVESDLAEAGEQLKVDLYSYYSILEKPAGGKMKPYISEQDLPRFMEQLPFNKTEGITSLKEVIAPLENNPNTTKIRTKTPELIGVEITLSRIVLYKFIEKLMETINDNVDILSSDMTEVPKNTPLDEYNVYERAEFHTKLLKELHKLPEGNEYIINEQLFLLGNFVNKLPAPIKRSIYPDIFTLLEECFMDINTPGEKYIKTCDEILALFEDSDQYRMTSELEEKRRIEENTIENKKRQFTQMMQVIGADEVLMNFLFLRYYENNKGNFRSQSIRSFDEITDKNDLEYAVLGILKGWENQPTSGMHAFKRHRALDNKENLDQRKATSLQEGKLIMGIFFNDITIAKAILENLSQLATRLSRVKDQEEIIITFDEDIGEVHEFLNNIKPNGAWNIRPPKTNRVIIAIGYEGRRKEGAYPHLISVYPAYK